MSTLGDVLKVHKQRSSAWKAMQDARKLVEARDYQIMRKAALHKGQRKLPNFNWIDIRGMPLKTKRRVWPKGVQSRVSYEAYLAVTRLHDFDEMTPIEREAAAVSYDRLTFKEGSL